MTEKKKGFELKFTHSLPINIEFLNQKGSARCRSPRIRILIAITIYVYPSWLPIFVIVLLALYVLIIRRK